MERLAPQCPQYLSVIYNTLKNILPVLLNSLLQLSILRLYTSTVFHESGKTLGFRYRLVIAREDFGDRRHLPKQFSQLLNSIHNGSIVFVYW